MLCIFIIQVSSLWASIMKCNCKSMCDEVNIKKNSVQHADFNIVVCFKGPAIKKFLPLVVII